MITFRLSELWQLKDPIANLMEQKLPVKTSYWLIQSIKKINAELQNLEEQKNVIVSKYGKLNEETEMVQVLPDSEDYEKFRQELEEVLNIEVTLDIQPKTIDDLGNLVMETNELLSMAKLFSIELE